MKNCCKHDGGLQQGLVEGVTVVSVEDGSNMLLQIIGTHLQVYMAFHHRRTSSSSSEP
jgi:hypothetical protein